MNRHFHMMQTTTGEYAMLFRDTEYAAKMAWLFKTPLRNHRGVYNTIELWTAE